MKKILFIILCLFLCKNTFSQTKQMPTGEILQALKKLNVVGSAMYVAAHPDDENTLLIAYLSKERMVRTAYISMTRGDGGQNLIGAEQSEYVGLLRTHELLAARNIDGGEQFFTRANDFGFTKTTDEALETWGKENTLADLVWRIRKFQPDVMINRFPPDSRAGHGHHSASAVLSAEAFAAAADPSRFPEQLAFVKPWQVKRLVWNSYSPGFQNNAPDGSSIKIDLGDFNPLLGKSYSEIAADARSMHKSQGFGSAKNRNKRSDYALHIAGEPAKNDLFDGIDLSWKRISGGEKIEQMVNGAIQNFKPENPSLTIPALLTIYSEIEKLEVNVWTQAKKKDVNELIAACAGLWFEANPVDYSAAAGEKIKVNVNIVKRSEANISLEKIQFTNLAKDSTLNFALKNSEALNLPFDVIIADNQAITQPYWLVDRWEKGAYKVDNQELRGLPMKPSDLLCNFSFIIEGKRIIYELPLTYKYVEPSDGEIYRYFEIRPEVTATIAEKVYAFADNSPKEIEVILKAGKKDVSGTLTLEIPKTWRIEPSSIPFDLKDKYEERKVIFKVFPSIQQSEVTLKAVASTSKGKFSRGLATIEYKHLPTLTFFPFAEAKLLKIDLQKKGNRIGYIAGAGDVVPAALRQIGYQVVSLTTRELDQDLSAFDAIIVGVRAYNTEVNLKFYQEKLMKYVENGGNMVVQYQTFSYNSTLKVKEIGPFPLSISGNRVTQENAAVSFLKPSHPLLNTPNKITQNDFNGWVQERGLYFANKWDEKYQTILAMNDPNEPSQEGSLLYVPYGKGNYIFTGLAFFRELPAGVPGAYRLFANLISVEKR